MKKRKEPSKTSKAKPISRKREYDPPGGPKRPEGTTKKVSKGVWRMPRLSSAKKDVISCEKLR